MGFDFTIGDENTLGGGNTATSVSVPPSGGVRRFKPGDEILGRYVVESELGQGGMGVVYKCLDKVGGVKVAVKGVPPDVAHNAGEMEEIRENFQLVCELRHPNIAGVRTLEMDVDGDYYLVMDLAHGDDLVPDWRPSWRSLGRLHPRSTTRTAARCCTATSSPETSWFRKRGAYSSSISDLPRRSARA